MYDGDTFFQLSFTGRIGLVILSTLLACITVWLFLKISSRFGLFVKVLIAAIFLWLFTWLSPQVYYIYYWFLFEGLPVQMVVGWPPTPGETARLATFTGPANLSAHSKGLLFWLMVATLFYPKRP